MILYRPSLSAKFRLSPEFVLEVLRDVDKVGIQTLLESQPRSGPNEYYSSCRSHQHLDPRTLSSPDQLSPATDEMMSVPEGCSFLHELIFLLEGKTTDAYGWQYKSTTGGGGGEEEDMWTPSPSHRVTARRRVWFRAYCATASCAAAKKKLSDEIIVRCRGGESLRGELWKEGHLNKTWKKRYFILTDKSLDYYTGQPSVVNKQGTFTLLSPLGCHVKKLYGQQCPGRSFGIIVQEGLSSNNDEPHNNHQHQPHGRRRMLLDAYSEHERSDWVFHVSYILALLSPSLSFAPLPTSPPFQVRPEEEILFRGDLFKQGHLIHTWTHRHFELTRTVLRYYDGCCVKGTVTLLDATLTDLADAAAAAVAASSASPNRNSSHNKEASLEFSITSRSGYLLKMRAPSQVAKEEWLEAMASAVALAGNPSLTNSSSMRLQRSSSMEGSEQTLEFQAGESASSARRRSTVHPSTSAPDSASPPVSSSTSKDVLRLLMLSLAVLLLACLAAANKAGLIRFLR